MEEKMLRIEEVAFLVGVSSQTINVWYRWKNNNPDNEFAKFLPDYTQEGKRKIRLWKQSDIWRIRNFKDVIPHGRNGILGDVTQKYRHNNKED